MCPFKNYQGLSENKNFYIRQILLYSIYPGWAKKN